MELRPYQQEAVKAVEGEWDKGVRRTLLVLPTGTGKTIVFAQIAADAANGGGHVLVMAHRRELLSQAADKIHMTTGASCDMIGQDYTPEHAIAIGSVQGMQRESRLEQFPPDYFTTIIVDEAHHSLSQGYQRVLTHFDNADVLGVTATPDRGDMRNLGQYFESLAYEYTLPEAIKDGYLCRIEAEMIPLQIDLSSAKVQMGDFTDGSLGSAIEPYLESIAEEMAHCCLDRKTVVFLPLISTSQKFCGILNGKGFRAAEVNGNSPDREDILRDFENGKYNVLCNSMLLTEGWDCPSVDCVVVLRPTKVRSLYCLDEETEILTADNRWVTSATVGDKIKVFDPETGKIKTDTVKAAIRRPLNKDEYFCSFNGMQNDIRVTNRHRMLYDNKRKKGWKYTTAENLASLKDGEYVPVSGHGDFPGVPLTDAELRFIGWFLSDGTLNKYNNAIYISQSEHQPQFKDLEECLQECGFKYGKTKIISYTPFHETSQRYQFSISHGKPRGSDRDKRGWEELEAFIGKDVPDSLFQMTEAQFDTMIEAVHLGNGAKQKNQSWTSRSYHISTGHKIQADRLQIMAVQRGWKCNLSVEMKGRKHPVYILHMKKKDSSFIGSTYGRKTQWKMEPHTDESCWCVQTDAGTLITRRHGKVTFMGNCQMVGRGTRLSPGKDHLLLLDFLWMSERHNLCHPASLICRKQDVADKMTQNMIPGVAIDVEDAAEQAERDVIEEREQTLAKQLAEMRHRKKKLVDPLQYAMSIQNENLTDYVPTFGWEADKPTDKQLKALENFGIMTDSVSSKGMASQLLSELSFRANLGLATAKQIRFLESRGFQHVGEWHKDDASRLIGWISQHGWAIPANVDPETYKPKGV